MDPVTVVGIVEGSIRLAVKCGSVAKSLNCLAGQYKFAKLTISTMVQNLDIMKFAWDRIEVWSKDFMPMDDDDALTRRLERFLETGSFVLDALEEDLESYDVSRMSFAQRSRLVWNENIFQAHQNRVRDQTQSMGLLLQALQLPTRQTMADRLEESETQLMKSDESAFSIVPSRLSMFTDRTSIRDSNSSYTSMVYRRLSFEDDLFTAKVYKRNYRNERLQRHCENEHDLNHEYQTPQPSPPDYVHNEHDPNCETTNPQPRSPDDVYSEHDLDHETTNPNPTPPDSVHFIQRIIKPSMNDELSLCAGQLVGLQHVYDDGWVLRLDRSQKSVAPRSCLSDYPMMRLTPIDAPEQGHRSISNSVETELTNLERKRKDGSTLDAAIRLGSSSFVEMFIENGVDPNCCRDDGGTGLHTFLTRSNAPTSHNIADRKILRLLLDRIDLSARDHSGKTVLESVFQSVGARLHVPAKVDLAKFLLESLPKQRPTETKMLLWLINDLHIEQEEIDSAA